MAIITKTIDGYGPYKYRVIYEDGEHHWEYIGPAGEAGDGEQEDSSASQTRTDEVDVPSYVDDSIDELVEQFDSVEFVEDDGVWRAKGVYEGSSTGDEFDEINAIITQWDTGAARVSVGVDDGPRGKVGKTWDSDTAEDLEVITNALNDVGSGDATVSLEYDEPQFHYELDNGDVADVKIQGRQSPEAQVSSDWMGRTAGNLTSHAEVKSFLTAKENYVEYGDDDSIVAVTKKDTRYGDKVGVVSPFDAKDDIKSLDFDDHHQSWDSDLGMWFVDEDSVDEVSEELREDGWEVKEGEF
jgi:hypothetical protein